MNNPTCTSDTFLHSFGFQLANQNCMRGKGGNTLLVDMEIEGAPEFTEISGCSKDFWQAG